MCYCTMAFFHLGTFALNTTSISIEQDTLPGGAFVENRKGAEGRQVTETGKKYKVMLRVYRQLLESVKSVLLVFAFLGVYKVAGLQDFWIELMEKCF